MARRGPRHLRSTVTVLICRGPIRSEMKELLVQFQANIPVEVSLKYANRKDIAGQHEDQVLYTLTDVLEKF